MVFLICKNLNRARAIVKAAGAKGTAGMKRGGKLRRKNNERQTSKEEN